MQSFILQNSYTCNAANLSGNVSYWTGAPVCKQVNFTFNARLENGSCSVAQVFVVPANVSSLIVELHGASGGAGSGDVRDWGNYLLGTATTSGNLPGVGGRGGRLIGSFTVTPGSRFYIFVGCKGGNAAPNCTAGGGGGGSTDIRLNSEFVTTNNPSSRLLVAGGGGGGGGSDDPCLTITLPSSNQCNGGNGGDGGSKTGGQGGVGSAGEFGGGGGSQLNFGAGGSGDVSGQSGGIGDAAAGTASPADGGDAGQNSDIITKTSGGGGYGAILNTGGAPGSNYFCKPTGPAGGGGGGSGYNGGGGGGSESSGDAAGGGGGGSSYWPPLGPPYNFQKTIDDLGQASTLYGGDGFVFIVTR